MVYKIIGDFKTDNFKNILHELQIANFRFMYSNNALYVAVLNYRDYKDKTKEEILKVVKDIFQPSDDFVVREVNEDNLGREDRMIMEWCRDCLVDLDTQKYEANEQERLHATWKAMDKMEEILHKEYIKRFNEGTLGKDINAKDVVDINSEDFIF